MKTRFVSYPVFGSTRSILPDVLQGTVTPPLGELPTGSLEYPRAGIKSSSLDGDCEVAFEFHNGTSWVEPPNCRFLSMGGSSNALNGVDTRSYKLLGFGWLLRRAKVWEAGTLPIDADGKVQFLSATPGNIMATLITKAKARGWGAGVAYDFTATTDSSGAAWSKIITMAFDLEVSLDTIITNLYQQGMADFRWEGRTLRMFNPDTTMAAEKPAVRLALADGATSAPEEWTNEDRLTDTLVVGEGGRRWTFSNGASNGPYGRLEQVSTQSGVNDQGTASLLSQKDLLAGIAARTSYTQEFTLPARVAPLVDYGVGDWVRAQRGTTFERLRVVSISLTIKPDGVTGHAVLGSRLDGLLAKLAKRTAGITGGATAGGSGGRPAPAGPDLRVPAAPTNLTVAADVYVTENGLPAGRLQAQWAHAGMATNGTAMAPDRYEVQRRVNVTGEKWVTVATTPDLLTVNAPVPVYKADGTTAEQYSTRVRAVATTGTRSAWTVETVTTMQKDTTAAYVPYFVQANLSTWLRTIKITWGGKGTTTGTNQLTMPPDLDRVNVYESTASNMAGAVLAGSIRDGENFVITGAKTAGTTYYYALTSVDRSGNESAYSTIRNITPAANVNADEILATLDAAKVTLSNVAGTSLLDKAVLRAKLADNAVDLGKLDNAVQTAIAEGQTALSNQTGINSSISTLQGSVNGKNTITNATTDASGAGVSSGDRWQKWTTLAAGGKLLKTWRWNGTAWVEEVLDASYLPLVDIGQGTFGSLDGGRLTANSVIAGALKVTDLAAFAPSMAESVGDWVFTGGMAAVTTSLDASGTRPQVTDNTGTAWAIGPRKAVKPGEKLYGFARVYRGGSNTGQSVYLRYYWFDKGGAALGTAYTDVQVNSAAGNGGTLSGAVTVPAGAAYADYRLAVTSGTGATGFYELSGYKQNGTVLIEDGAITGDKVVVNALTAKHITIGDFTDMAVGSDFEDAAAIPWALHSLHTRSTTQKKSGTASLRLAPSATTSTSTFSGDTRVKEGDQWYIRFHAYLDSTFNGTSTTRVRVTDQSGTQIGDIPFHAITKSAWTTTALDGTFTVPAGVTSLKIELWSNQTAGNAYVDELQIRRVAEPSLIQSLGVEKLTASTAAMGTAVIDKLFTDVVKSRSITAEMLNIGRGDNMIAWNVKNVPSTAAPHIPMSGGVFSYMTDSTHSGKTSLYVTGQAVTSGTWTQFMRFQSGFTADNGSLNHWNAIQDGKLVIESWFRAGGTYTNGNPKVRFQVAFQTAAGSFHSIKYSTEMAIDFTWKNLSYEFSVPSAAASIYIYVQQDQPGGVRVDDPFMAPQYQASLISQGAILTRHLTVTEDMTVALLNVHKIKAVDIDANDIVADTATIGTLRGGILITDAVTTSILKADAITSKHTITGATVQTSATALRGIKLTGNDLKAYNGTGVETFSIEGSTGAVVATGTFRTGTSGNYINISANAGGGIMHMFTGNGSGRGSVWARDDGNPRMSLAYSNLDEPSGTLPVVVLKSDEAYMNYGSRTIKVWNNAGSEELLLDATNASVVLRGNLDMRSGRIQLRYGSATPLGYVGQAPASGSSPDMEIRADAGAIRLVGLLRSLSTYNSTTTLGSNMVVSASGDIMRSTSASRYKLDQKVLTVPDAALDIEVKDWVDKEEMARKKKLDKAPRPLMEHQSQQYDAVVTRRIPGLIAEDLVAAGLEQFVLYGADGKTEGVMYDRFALAQIAVLKRQLAKLNRQLTALAAAGR